MTYPRIYKEGHPKTFERDPATNELVNIDKQLQRNIKTVMFLQKRKLTNS